MVEQTDGPQVPGLEPLPDDRRHTPAPIGAHQRLPAAAHRQHGRVSLLGSAQGIHQRGQGCGGGPRVVAGQHDGKVVPRRLQTGQHAGQRTVARQVVVHHADVGRHRQVVRQGARRRDGNDQIGGDGAGRVEGAVQQRHAGEDQRIAGGHVEQLGYDPVAQRQDGDRQHGAVGQLQNEDVADNAREALAVTGLLVIGTRESATVNAVLVGVKVLALTVFIALRTLSRSGYYSMAVTLLFLTARFTRNPRTLLMALFLAGAAYFLVPTALTQRLEAVQSIETTSRYRLTVIGMRMAVANPVLGVGWHGYRHEFLKYDTENFYKKAKDAGIKPE